MNRLVDAFEIVSTQPTAGDILEDRKTRASRKQAFKLGVKLMIESLGRQVDRRSFTLKRLEKLEARQEQLGL